jgi:hypothetical protein
MTIGDHQEIRRLYADIIRGKLESTLSAEKVLKEDGTGRRKLTHLIISNYPLEYELAKRSGILPKS